MTEKSGPQASPTVPHDHRDGPLSPERGPSTQDQKRPQTKQGTVAYILTATTPDGEPRRAVYLSQQKANEKHKEWMMREWIVEKHRVSLHCLDCGWQPGPTS